LSILNRTYLCASSCTFCVFRRWTTCWYICHNPSTIWVTVCAFINWIAKIRWIRTTYAWWIITEGYHPSVASICAIIFQYNWSRCGICWYRILRYLSLQ
jgi:hypothetical protein